MPIEVYTHLFYSVFQHTHNQLFHYTQIQEFRILGFEF